MEPKLQLTIWSVGPELYLRCVRWSRSCIWRCGRWSRSCSSRFSQWSRSCIWRFASLMEWNNSISSKRPLIFLLLPKLPTCFPFMSVALYLSTPAQTEHSAGLVCLQHHSWAAVSSQQSAVNCWTQHVNKYVQLSSSTNGRCHTDRGLCLIWARVNSWYNTLFELHCNNSLIYNFHAM